MKIAFFGTGLMGSGFVRRLRAQGHEVNVWNRSAAKARALEAHGARAFDDPAKELAFNGVYRFSNGRIQAVVRDLNRPNGLAFSPDYKTLYVNNSDPTKDLVMRYDVAADGTLVNGRLFANLTSKIDGLADGMKVDARGNVYTTGPGGVWVLSPSGKHLGTIEPPEMAANCAWGDDGKTLYMTAVTGIYRVRTLVGQK